MNIFDQLNKGFEKEFSAMKSEARPYTQEALEIIAQAKADAHEGKEPQSDDPLYLEEYSIFKSCKIIGEAK